VRLPVAGKLITVKTSDKVIVSLRTKDPGLAKTRFHEAIGALTRHWDAVRAGPKPLPYKQIVALAGEAYQRRVQRLEEDPHLVPHGVIKERDGFETATDFWRTGEDGLPNGLGGEDARTLARMQRPYGPQLMALEAFAGFDDGIVSITLEQALDDLFGPEADLILARHHLVTDPASRTQLLREIGKAVHFVQQKLNKNTRGDFSPDENAARFPAFEPPAPGSPAPQPEGAAARITVPDLFALTRSAGCGPATAGYAVRLRRRSH
jgi:hypothetical protein